MDPLQAALLGVVEGLTEFLPLSSTFHLIWATRLLGLEQTAFQKLYLVVIQSGAILAVLALYLRTLLEDRALVARVAVSFLPTAIVGFLLARVITDVFFEDQRLQLGAFALVGVLFIVAERAWRDRRLERDPRQLSYGEAALVGLAQALAVVPGVSRAGAVMLALMALGVSREAAARYSFLLALPTIVAASAFDLVREREVLAAAADGLLLLGVGLVVSFVTALLVMRWFIGYLQRHSLVAFGAYRLVVAAALVALLAFGT